MRELRKEHGRSVREHSRSRSDAQVAKLQGIVQRIAKIATGELKCLKQQLAVVRREVTGTKFPA